MKIKYEIVFSIFVCLKSYALIYVSLKRRTVEKNKTLKKNFYKLVYVSIRCKDLAKLIAAT